MSDPYEEPRDADLALDTSAMTRQEAVDAVLKLLTAGGWLPAPGEPTEASGAAAPVPSGTVLRLGSLGPAVRRL